MVYRYPLKSVDVLDFVQHDKYHNHTMIVIDQDGVDYFPQAVGVSEKNNEIHHDLGLAFVKDQTKRMICREFKNELESYYYGVIGYATRYFAVALAFSSKEYYLHPVVEIYTKDDNVVLHIYDMHFNSFVPST